MKYNMEAKTQMGRNPNAMQDSMHMQVNHRSINLLDFERNQEKDLIYDETFNQSLYQA